MNNNTIRCGKLEFSASYGVIIQSVIHSFLKTPVCGASLSYINMHLHYVKIFYRLIHTLVLYSKESLFSSFMLTTVQHWSSMAHVFRRKNKFYKFLPILNAYNGKKCKTTKYLLKKFDHTILRKLWTLQIIGKRWKWKMITKDKEEKLSKWQSADTLLKQQQKKALLLYVDICRCSLIRTLANGKKEERTAALFYFTKTVNHL